MSTTTPETAIAVKYNRVTPLDVERAILVALANAARHNDADAAEKFGNALRAIRGD